jgi:hypothetical protein
MNKNIVGMAWYKPENFNHLREMYEDGNMLQPTYGDWRQTAETAVLAHQVKGVRVVKVNIDPVEFPKWLASKGLRMNAQGRLAYLQYMTEQVAKARDAETEK